MGIYNQYGAVNRDLMDKIDHLVNRLWAAIMDEFGECSPGDLRTIVHEIEEGLSIRMSEQVLRTMIGMKKSERKVGNGGTN